MFNDPAYLLLAPSAVSAVRPTGNETNANNLHNTSDHALPQAIIGKTLSYCGFGAVIIGGGGGGGGGGEDGGGDDAFPRPQSRGAAFYNWNDNAQSLVNFLMIHAWSLPGHLLIISNSGKSKQIFPKWTK